MKLGCFQFLFQDVLVTWCWHSEVQVARYIFVQINMLTQDDLYTNMWHAIPHVKYKGFILKIVGHTASFSIILTQAISQPPPQLQNLMPSHTHMLQLNHCLNQKKHRATLSPQPYCWWTKSCINHGIIIILGGAGFCPSTL